MLEFVGFHAGNCRPLLTQMSEFVTQACGKLSSRRPLRSQWQSAGHASACDEEKLPDRHRVDPTSAVETNLPHFLPSHEACSSRCAGP